MANILLGVTGGIAIYKSLELIRLYVKNGHHVKVMMSAYAEKFITPLTFEVISSNTVLTDNNETRSISHIELATWADICVIAPATANTIAKINSGIADSPMLSTILALRSPVLLAPSMNTFMYNNIITQRNINELKKVGIRFIEPISGMLACGDEGVGKLPDVKNIYEESINILNKIDKTCCVKNIKSNSSLDIKTREYFKGKRIIVTGGGTVEDIDPVRYIGNHSSGKMGFAVATLLQSYGADVKFIAGKVDSNLSFEKQVNVKSADDMYNEIKKDIIDTDILIMAAAVADFKVANISNEKIKKTENLTLKLVKNIDILSTLSKEKKANQLFVGFAAESSDLEKNAIEKLNRKGLDMIVANDIKRGDIGFNSDMNEVIIFSKNGNKVKSAKAKKSEIAEFILNEIVKLN